MMLPNVGVVKYRVLESHEAQKQISSVTDIPVLEKLSILQELLDIIVYNQ